MDLRILTDKNKNAYNKLVTHVIQSWEWGEFREKQGTPVLRYGLFENNKMVRAFQLTLHKIPLTSQYVGYLPKGPLPDKELAQALEQIGQEQHCAFIKLEPDIISKSPHYNIHPCFLTSPKPLFTKFNFLIDLTKSEDELLKNMHQKTRYNIKVAQKNGVTVEERTDDEALKIYLDLYFDTTQRQQYLGHNRSYHKKVWETLRASDMVRLVIGFYTPPGTKQKIPLNAWMLMNFKDTLYYPYGGSSDKFKNVMAPTLVAWEAIKLGKKMKLKKFDLWGALGTKWAKPDHPFYGFHSFKEKLGGELVEYVGSFDLIFNDPLYWAFTVVDKMMPLKLFLLKLVGR